MILNMYDGNCVFKCSRWSVWHRELLLLPNIIDKTLKQICKQD